MKSETNMDGNEFWVRLKEALAQHDDNLSKLAKRTGIPYNTLYQKCAFGKLPTDGQLQKIAGAMSMTAGDLRRGNFAEYAEFKDAPAPEEEQENVEEAEEIEKIDSDEDMTGCEVQSDNAIKAIDNSEDRLWTLGKVHDIIGLVICKDQVVNKLTALRKAIDVTIYFLEDK